MNKQDKKTMIEKYLNMTFFNNWKQPNLKNDVFEGLELQITSECNLDCEYCYYKHNKKLNDYNPSKHHKITIDNTKKLFEYFKKNNLYPKRIDIFSGEPLIHNITYEIIDIIINYYKNTDKKVDISIPTNMQWIRLPKFKEKVFKLLEKVKKYSNIYIGLSASIDGKYLDPLNRPFIKHELSEKIYSDDFYNQIFDLSTKYFFGFHPMISAKNIHLWKDNFLWFQQKFEEYNIPWNNIYLLEVRNSDWTKKSLQEYKEFMLWLYNWIFIEKFKGDSNYFVNEFIFGKFNMNLFTEFSSHSRGIGCSLQTTFHIRLYDLTVNACHRLSYKELNGFQFIPNKEKILDIYPLNFEFYFTTHIYNHSSAPYCEKCNIRYLCSGGCLGANYESTKEAFITHPDVCMMLKTKILTQVEFLYENNMFNEVIKRINKQKEENLKEVLNEYKSIKS